MRNAVHIGDCLEVLKTLPEGCVHCCVTSPPYFGLRDYNVEGQIGLEETPGEYVQKLVEVFREVRRVLRPDGALWLVIGDSYTSGGRTWRAPDPKDSKGGRENRSYRPSTPEGLKPKDLIGIPWMLAFALRADGWWLRSDIIWAKANVMPESVTDRPTTSHEHIFLLTKREQYFYDQNAIREPHKFNRWSNSKLVDASVLAAQYKGQAGKSSLLRSGENLQLHPEGGRNKRTVWHINPRAYPEAHFATFPEEIPKTCIKAGTSEKGCCPACGAPWVRVIERETYRDVSEERPMNKTPLNLVRAGWRNPENQPRHNTVGWQPTCDCPEHEPIPCIVLDPFAGSGTTLATAKWLRRDYVGIELNPEYARLIEKRLQPALDQEAQQQVFDYMATLPEDES